MSDLIVFLKNFLLKLSIIIVKALSSYWDFVQDLVSSVASSILQRINDILPESANVDISSIMDYFECFNYYFPVKELFVIITIYLQFRMALLIVRLIFKTATLGIE